MSTCWKVTFLYGSSNTLIISNPVLYLVQWQGYPPEENTWEPISSFQDFPEVLQEFEANNSLIEVSNVFVITVPTEKYLF
jgi:hypothetical protein